MAAIFLDLVRGIINEDDLPLEMRHIEFSTNVLTFIQVRQELRSDIKNFRRNPVWSKSLPDETFYDKVLSVYVSLPPNSFIPIILDLTLGEIECINQVFRNRIEEASDKDQLRRDGLIETFVNFNHDFQMAGGMMSPTFESFIK